MEHEDQLLCSQVSATDLCADSGNLIHYVLKIHSDIILSSTNPSSVWFLCFRISQPAFPFVPLRATCPADFILLA